MVLSLAYCGAPPVPGELSGRFNIDPILILCLAFVACLHLYAVAGQPAKLYRALAGWSVATAAFISPLCALSVSLFSARVGQHMILMLIAAPLIAGSLPSNWQARSSLWSAVAAFFALFWFWHMPAPYDATFHSTAVYWLMHISLFGSSIWLWHVLLLHAPADAAHTLIAGMVASIQMSLLGAVITLSARAMYAPHLFTTQAWGFTPLSDQQLGGALMWVPSCLLFLWVALRSLTMLWRSLEQEHVA